jgi:glycosyltransferase involved in cell wall biosynthesis
VFPSIEGEGFPNVLGEAMATGLPCITSDVSECAGIVGDGGIVVPARDADALAAAMERLVDIDRHEHERMAIAARRRVIENFEMGEVAARYVAFYDRLARARRLPAGKRNTISATTPASAATAGLSRRERTVGR